MDVYGAFCSVKGKEAEITKKNYVILTLKSTIKTLSNLGNEGSGGSVV